ncbi:MAG: glycosyltransferase family 2 protein [Mariprofundaceae bacterium]|nr:glycosyltransferase family 2 protein [Mariprofundaceae bacterium]
MNKNGLVSIIIPVYNREDLIGETIESALSQTYPNIEIIIVDNASTDSTWKKCQAYALQDKRVRIFRNDENIGPVRNWARCIDEATGYYGKILWSDDLIAPDFLEKTVPYLANHNEVGFVFTRVEVFSDEMDERVEHYDIGETGIYKSNQYIKGTLLEGSLYPTSPGCTVFRLKDLSRSLLIDVPNKVGSDFSKHAIGNDLLMLLLTANKYHNFAFVNEKLSFFRAHADSISTLSDEGKLPLHYDLVKAYFIENYRMELIKKFNVQLLVDIKRHGKSREYCLDKIGNFYLKNTDYSLDFNYLIRKMISTMLKRIFSR